MVFFPCGVESSWDEFIATLTLKLPTRGRSLLLRFPAPMSSPLPSMSLQDSFFFTGISH